MEKATQAEQEKLAKLQAEELEKARQLLEELENECSSSEGPSKR